MSEIYPVSTIPRDVRIASDPWVQPRERFPAPRRLVLYETEKLLRLGYVDETQQWRRLNGIIESDKVISWRIAPGKAAAAINTSNAQPAASV